MHPRHGRRYCDLCLTVTEKYAIVRTDQEHFQNERAEITSTYRHRSKYFIKSVKKYIKHLTETFNIIFKA